MTPNSTQHNDSPAGEMPRRDFLKTSVAAAGALGTALGADSTVSVQAAEPAQGRADEGRMKIGVNLEYVRHADKSLAYGLKTAGQMGLQVGRAVLPHGPLLAFQRRLLPRDEHGHRPETDSGPVRRGGREDQRPLLALRPSQPGVGRALRPARHPLRSTNLGVNVVQITEDMYPPKWMTEQDAYDVMKINLRAIAETCAENGVFFGVEQHGPYTAKIKSLTRILELVDSPWIRVNYDCGNTFLSGEDPYAMLEAVIGKVVHVHAKDISRQQADAERGKVTGTAVGCACGDGEIDWHRIVKRLKEAGYKGVLSVECGTEPEAKRR